MERGSPVFREPFTLTKQQRGVFTRDTLETKTANPFLGFTATSQVNYQHDTYLVPNTSQCDDTHGTLLQLPRNISMGETLERIMSKTCARVVCLVEHLCLVRHISAQKYILYLGTDHRIIYRIRIPKGNCLYAQTRRGTLASQREMRRVAIIVHLKSA